jgi:hypothetical protein
LKNRRG